MSGCFQAVEIRAPKGATISAAAEGSFDSPRPAPVRVGMLVGPIYRLRVMNIPLAPGVEVFPTVEVVDRIYAPQGQELRFAIPVELTSEELRLAAAGKFVTRVIYVEDPHAAVPVAHGDKHQDWFDVEAGQDPYKMAKNLGRPVAVLRMGGRLPDSDPEGLMRFLCGCPPLVQFESPDGPTQAPAAGKLPEVKQASLAQKQPVQGPITSISEPVENTPAVSEPVERGPVARANTNGVKALPPPPKNKR